MKKSICILSAVFLLLSALVAMRPGNAELVCAGTDDEVHIPSDSEAKDDLEWMAYVEPVPDEAESALFDDGVSAISCSAWGNLTDFAFVNGWTVNRGFCEGNYEITGLMPDGSERVVLAADNERGFVPADGAIVHYGTDDTGEDGWLISAPDNPLFTDSPEDGKDFPYPEDSGYGWKDTRLPLHKEDTVFYADYEVVWYYTPSKNDQSAIGRVGRDGTGKKKLGTVSGRVVAMLPGNQVLLADFSKNQVRLWGSGKYETIYSPEEAILAVTSVGKGVWVAHEGWYGPLADGEITFRLPGKIAGMAGTTDQFVLLVLPYEKAAFFDVMIFNETYRAYAMVGRVMRSDSTHIELQQNQMIVWEPVESVVFGYPGPEKWLPYGYHDNSSAKNLLHDDEEWMQLLIGSWCSEPSAGSNSTERLIFSKDELYRLHAQTGSARAKVKKSLWYVSEGLLLDYVDRDAPRPLWLSGPFPVPDSEGSHSIKIMIDGIVYYQYSGDPLYFDDLRDYGIDAQSLTGM